MGVNLMLFMADLNYVMVLLLFPSFPGDKCLSVCLGSSVLDLTRMFLLYTGVPPLVLRRVLEILTYLATNHSGVASLLFHFESSNIPDFAYLNQSEGKNAKGKEKITGGLHHTYVSGSTENKDVPLILLLRLLSEPLFLRSIAHLEQVCFITSASF